MDYAHSSFILSHYKLASMVFYIQQVLQLQSPWAMVISSLQTQSEVKQQLFH